MPTSSKTTEHEAFMSHIEKLEKKIDRYMTFSIYATATALAIEVLGVIVDFRQKDWRLLSAHVTNILWIGVLLTVLWRNRKMERVRYQGWVKDQNMINRLFEKLEEGTTLIQKIVGMASSKTKIKKEDMD